MRMQHTDTKSFIVYTENNTFEDCFLQNGLGIILVVVRAQPTLRITAIIK